MDLKLARPFLGFESRDKCEYNTLQPFFFKTLFHSLKNTLPKGVRLYLGRFATESISYQVSSCFL